MKSPTHLETALAAQLRGETKANMNDFLFEVGMDEGDPDIHTEVEIAIVPSYAKGNLDTLWIERLNNQRQGAVFKPGQELTEFFKFINVHPSLVLNEEDFRITPAVPDIGMPRSHLTPAYCRYVNKTNADMVTQYLSLLTDFETDNEHNPLCSAEIARVIIDNAGYGGYPLISGRARISDILALDFDQEICIDGRYMVGIHDNVNGSGHMESCTAKDLKLKLSQKDIIVCSTKGYTPDSVFGFVGYYYRFDLSNAKVTEPA